MGAFDFWAGSAHCPRCGDVLFLSDETKFFSPEFGRFHNRDFTCLSWHPLSFAPEELHREHVWEGDWWRVRAGGPPGVLELLDALRTCHCGAPLAVVLRFRIEADEDTPGRATLTSITLHEALDAGLASAVDFAYAKLTPGTGRVVPWTGDYVAFKAGLEALAAAPFPERATRLHKALTEWFTEVEEGEGWGSEDQGFVAGPMLCDDCGTVRERKVRMDPQHSSVAQQFPGLGWRGGVLRAGSHIDGDFGWLAEDVDRGHLLRLRHPLPPGQLTIIGRPQEWGCQCQAGWASLVLGFNVDAQGATLGSIRIRAVHSKKELNGVDFADSPNFTRPSPQEGYQRKSRGPRLDSREEAIEALVKEWRDGG